MELASLGLVGPGRAPRAYKVEIAKATHLQNLFEFAQIAEMFVEADSRGHNLCKLDLEIDRPWPRLG